MTSPLDPPLHSFPHYRPFGTHGARPQGVLGAMELPFEVVRFYMVTEVGDPVHWTVDRGGHAHRRCQQLFFCPKGSVRIDSTDGRRKLSHTIEEGRAEALYMPPWWWHEMKYKIGSICCALASLPYDEGDYIRSKDQFLTLVKKESS